MDAPIKREIVVDDVPIALDGYHEEQMYVLDVLAGTTGILKHRGDWGYGSRAVISFQEMEGVGVEVRVKQSELSTEQTFSGAQNVTLIFGGECEVRGLLKALRFAADKIEAILAGEKTLPAWASEQDRRDYAALPPKEQRKMRESFEALEAIGEIPAKDPKP